MAGDREIPEDYFTLLGVRADGVSSVVDLVVARELNEVRHRAWSLLREHASCETVEVWRSGGFLERLSRTALPA